MDRTAIRPRSPWPTFSPAVRPVELQLPHPLLDRREVGIRGLSQRILVPVKAHLLDRPADPQCLLVAVAPGRIEHDRVIVADGFAHRLANLDVVAPRLRRVDLVSPPPGRLVMP